MYAHYFSRVFISMCLFILSACAPVTLPSPELRADTAALEAAYTRCSQAFPDAKKRPTKPLFECRSRAARDNPAGIAAYFGPQNVDLVDVGSMRSIVAAEKYDDGKISRAEFDLELASTTDDVKKEMVRRSQVAAASQPQQASPAFDPALFAAGAAMMAGPAQPPMRTTNCRPLSGGKMTCQSFYRPRTRVGELQPWATSSQTSRPHTSA